MKKLLFILLLFISFSSCKCQDYIAFTSTIQTYERIKYGALYNWYAATDIRGISSSDDWVIGTQSQTNSLITYLGGNTVAGGKLKETGLIYWSSPNTGATNEANFNGRGSGDRNPTTGVFSSINNSGEFWTSTGSSSLAYSCALAYNNDDTSVAFRNKKYGLSIRLLYVGAGVPTSYIGNDGKIYPVVLIGIQYFVSMNLAETKFRNGDYIHGFESGTYTPISNANWAALITEGMCFYNDDPDAYK